MERGHQTLTSGSPALEKSSDPSGDSESESTVRLWAWTRWTWRKVASDHTTISPLSVPANMQSRSGDTARASTELSWCSVCTSSGGACG